MATIEERIEALRNKGNTASGAAATPSAASASVEERIAALRAKGNAEKPTANPYAEAAKRNFTPASEQRVETGEMTPVYAGVMGLYDKFGMQSGSRAVRGVNDHITLSKLNEEREDAEEMYDVYSALYGSGSTTPEEKAEALKQKERFAAKLEDIEKKTSRTKANSRTSSFAPDYEAIPKAPDFDVHGQLPRTEEPKDDMEEYLRLINEKMERSMDGTPVAEIERKDPFDFLTENEKKTYYYLKSKKGEGAAQSYLNNMAATIAERRGVDIAETLGKEKGPARAVQTGGFAVRSGFDQFGGGIIQTATEEVRPTTAVQIGAQKTREGLEDVGPKVLGSSLGQWGFDTAQTVGNMLPSMLISSGLGMAGAPAKIASLIGSASMGASAGGNTYAAAVREGMAPEDAREYGRLVGAAAGAMQYALGGIDKLSGGMGQKLARKAAGVENGFLRFIATHGANALSEASEEALEAVLEPVFREIVTDESADLDWGEVTYNALQGAITGFVLGGNGEADETSPLRPAMEKGMSRTLSPTQGTAVSVSPEGETKVVPPLPSVTKAGETEQTSSITEQRGTVPPLPTIASVRAQAEAEANRRAEMEKAKTIAGKFGVELREERLGAGHHGKYENGVITIDSDSDNPVMETFVHELTHHLESSGNYDRLRRAAMDYVSNNMQADVDSVLGGIVNEYAQGGIELDRVGAERELVAKFCAEQVFTDEASIMRLARTDRNLFQRIYDWICDTITKLGSDYDTRALIDARRKYEKALRTLGETQSGVKHSFSEKKIPTYDELVSKSDMHIVDIRGDDSRTFNEFKTSEEAEHLTKTPVVNKDTGEKVFITPKTFTHSFFGKGANKVNAAAKIRELIEYAVLTHGEPSRNERTAEMGVYTLFGAARTEKGVQPVKLKVKEYAVDGRDIPQVVKEYFAENGREAVYAQAYDSRVLVVEGIENEGSDSTVLAASYEADRYLSEPSEISIAELYELVNKQYPEYLPARAIKENGASPFETGAPKGLPGGDAPSLSSVLQEDVAVKQNGAPSSDKKVSYGSSLAEQVKKAEGKPAKKKPTDYRPTMAKRDLRRDLLGFFSVAEGNRAAMGNIIDGYADRLIKNGEISVDDRQWLFDALYESGVMTVQADEYLSIGRGAVAGGRIYVDESTRDEFGDDWNDFRRRAFGAGVYLTSDKADMGPYSWYSELAPTLPGLFDAGETDARAMLENIVRVAEEGKDQKMSLRDYTAMVAEQEHVSEDQFIEHMERQVDWALRAFGEKAGLELWFKKTIDDKVQRERERSFKTRQEQMQRQRENRELRELQQRTLKQLQWLSKNRNKAPEDLRAAWDEVLGDIDIYAINAANEMNWSDKHQATWKDLAQLYKDAKEHDPNFLPSKELEQIVSRLDDRKIGEMDIDALSDLYKAAVGLRTEFYNRKNVIADENHRLFADVYADAKEELTTAPGGYTGKGVDKLFNIQQLTPMNVFQRMAGWNPNSSWYSMGRQLEKGERDMRAYHVEANRQLETFLTENEDWVKRADGQGKDAIWYEIEVPELLELNMGDKPIFGDSVKVYMTPAQKVHLYLESKSEDNLRHMTGGRTFVDKELYSKGERREALAHGKTIKLAPETVKKIVSDMTPVEMELAKLLEGYYNSFAKERINKISNILYGFDKAVGRNYAPIYTNKNYTKAEIGTFDTTAEGVGNLKARQYSKNPSYNLSAFDAFERHVDQTARFVGMAIPARNWTTLLNWRESNNSMADVLTHKWGEEGKNYITGLIENLQAGKAFEKDVVSETADKVFSKYVSAVFGANPSIVLKQLGSIPLASAYLDARNIPTPAQVAGIDRALIGKYTSELDHRTMGYSMPETKLLKDNPGWTDTNKFVNFTFGGGAITAMDGWAASTLWPWAENKVRRDFPGLEVGTQEQIDSGKSPFYQKVAELYNDALTRTQSVSDETHQSTIRKSKNPLTRTFTMFKSDAAQGYNVLRQKVGEAQYYKRTGADSATRSRANRAAGGAVLALASGYLYAQGINFLVNLWKQQGKKYKDEEEGLNFGSVAKVMCMDLVSDFAGMVIGGGELAEVIGNVLTGEKWYGIEAPGTEQLADLADTIMQSVSELGGVVGDAASVLKQGGNVGEYLSSRSGDILGVVKDAAQTIATYIGGVSVNNVEAYLLGALKWISPKVAEAYEAAFDSTTRSDLSSLSGDALAVRVNGIFESRLDEVAPETVDALAHLYESGYKGAVPGDVPKTLTVDGEEISLNIYQQQLYNTAWSGAVRGAVDEVVASEAFAGADEQAREKMLKKLYDYAAQKAKAEVVDGYEADLWISEMDEALSDGVDMGDYLRGAAIESAAKGTKDEEGETITGSKAVEVMRQIDEMELSEVEKIELFASLGYDDTENMWTTEYKGADYEAFYYMSKSGRSGYLNYCDWLPVAEYAEYYEAYSDFKSDKDANGKTVKSKKEKVIEYIDRLDLTDDQKSALFVSFGYAMSSLEDCIWYNPIAMRSRYFPVG